MSKGYSLHVGMNRVNPNHYDGWSGDLPSCENDAIVMQKIAEQLGYNTELLLTTQANKKNLTTYLKEFSSSLQPDDVFLFTFSGHGGRKPQDTPDSSEIDRIDETLCLYDEMLIDDELKNIYWPLFKPGVRILCVFDSCHSGGMVKAAKHDKWKFSKLIPKDVVKNTFQNNFERYKEINETLKKNLLAKINAAVCIFAACEENQEALAGDDLSLFTFYFNELWAKDKFNDLEEFCEIIRSEIHRSDLHTPNIKYTGLDSKGVFAGKKPLII